MENVGTEEESKTQNVSFQTAETIRIHPMDSYGNTVFTYTEFWAFINKTGNDNFRKIPVYKLEEYEGNPGVY